MTITIDQIKTQVQNAPSLYGRPIAVLHQAVTPPSLNGAVKPSNPFGYRDSSADIANALAQIQGVATDLTANARAVNVAGNWGGTLHPGEAGNHYARRTHDSMAVAQQALARYG